MVSEMKYYRLLKGSGNLVLLSCFMSSGHTIGLFGIALKREFGLVFIEFDYRRAKGWTKEIFLGSTAIKKKKL